MRVFLDFEASSLAKDSYPIEVAWVFEDGRGEAHLIRPAPDWIDWDAAAQATHGVSRAELERSGEPHDAVARRMVEALDGCRLYASAPSWDGKWLSVLLRAAGLPRHALRLEDTDEAIAGEVDAALGPGAPDAWKAQALERILQTLRREREGVRPRHRALDDARGERDAWLRGRELARAQPSAPRP
jgi:hypothetical protein